MPGRISLTGLSVMACITLVYLLVSTQTRGTEIATHAIDLLTEQGMHDATVLWEDEIRARGAAGAYETLKDIYGGEGLMVQHSASHAFGEALYNVDGPAGLSVCDEKLQYGCFHSVSGRAIGEFGLEVARSLFSYCRGASEGWTPMFCAHGVGHGLIAHLGYEYDSLLESVLICENLETQKMRSGCLNGAFMEYNLRDMQFTDGRLIRLLTAENAMELCDPFSGDLERACHFSLPQWWRANLVERGMEDMDAYRVLGEKCSTLDGKRRTACFEGIGNIVPRSVGFVIEGVRERCAIAQQIPQDELSCRAAAASSFAAWGKPAVGEVLCDGFAAEATGYCLQYMGAIHSENSTSNTAL